MKEIAVRAWREPAIFIGLASTIILAIVVVTTGNDWDAATICGVAAPLVSALGIRELVMPVADLEHKTKPTPPAP